jgi:hypothetical protein
VDTARGANTNFFHTFANRRKTKTCYLDTETGVLTTQKEISQHIVQFYKKLFVSGMHKRMHVTPEFWSTGEQLGETEMLLLNAPFSERELALAVSGMKAESALRPNGFTMIFSKSFGNI